MGNTTSPASTSTPEWFAAVERDRKRRGNRHTGNGDGPGSTTGARFFRLPPVGPDEHVLLSFQAAWYGSLGRRVGGRITVTATHIRFRANAFDSFLGGRDLDIDCRAVGAVGRDGRFALIGRDHLVIVCGDRSYTFHVLAGGRKAKRLRELLGL